MLSIYWLRLFLTVATWRINSSKISAATFSLPPVELKLTKYAIVALVHFQTYLRIVIDYTWQQDYTASYRLRCSPKVKHDPT